MAGPGDGPLAAVDLGSNSFRLLIIAPQGEAWQVLVEERVRVGLARGLEGGGRLSRSAMARGLAALRRFRPHLRALGPRRVRAVATDTLRRAENRQAFLRPASRLLGVPVEVISGPEEAALIYAGAVAGGRGAAERRQLVLDIGGGSTEVAVGLGERPAQGESLPLGCIPLTGDHFPGGAMDEAALRSAEDTVRRLAAPALGPAREHGWQWAWGASGTVEAVVGLAAELGVLSPERGLDAAALAAVRERLLQSPRPAQRAGLPGVGAARAGVLPGGFAILTGLFEVLGLEWLAPARGALREGVVRGLMRDP